MHRPTSPVSRVPSFPPKSTPCALISKALSFTAFSSYSETYCGVFFPFSFGLVLIDDVLGLQGFASLFVECGGVRVCVLEFPESFRADCGFWSFR